MWIKLIGGTIAAFVIWYFVRDWLILLSEHIERSGFGRKITAEKKRSGFKFRDPLAVR